MKNIFRGEIKDDYVFEKTSAYIKKHNVIVDASIGDVTLPLSPKITIAASKAAKELSFKSSMRGYPAHNGYPFLRNAIKDYYADKGIYVSDEEIFVTHGIKNDLAFFLSLLGNVTVAVSRVGYPAYKDICNLYGLNINYYDDVLSASGDIIIVNSPSNPTGEVYDAKTLQRIIENATKTNSYVFFDSAYEAFCTATSSIFSVNGAKSNAIEFCSFSKTAGFTSLRCGYTVISKKNELYDVYRRAKAVSDNGVSYVTQRMAYTALTDAKAEVKSAIRYYLRSQEIIASKLNAHVGDSPYVWVRVPDGDKAFFDLIRDYGVAVMPGSAFGDNRYIRVSAFCSYEEAEIVSKAIFAYKKIQKNFL